MDRNIEKKTKKIIFTGGGTAGSVSPLLAIAEDLRAQPAFAKASPFAKASEDKSADKGGLRPTKSVSTGEGGFEFLFVGTKAGIEKQMVKDAGLRYRAIAAGKLRRYFDWRNFIDIFKIKLAFWQAFFIILKEKPDLVLSAGSFVAVPVVWAAWLLRVPVIVHQQDIRPGLANKLMAPLARTITVTFEKSLKDYGARAVWTGNPTRTKIKEQRTEGNFNLSGGLPVVFVVGGGTGAEGINKLVEQGLENLVTFCQIIHSTGKGKMIAKRHDNYHPFEFLNAEQMVAALSIADLIVSRAGLGALTEISAAGKPAIVIPMPDSHQEDNAALLVEKDAAVVLNQKILNQDSFVAAIKALLDNQAERERLGRNIKLLFKEGANGEIVKLILNILNIQ
ncbi:MAG: UDP-N-acetylglucosamine--N-acetylmuramyl-(pentapeptide) pyrophosphoryl-undecaprenol N-acetylglucosamine transferase [Patescibacteria group bacterium]|nr:UDP-N-acetylglucosamine--N-acetylmuramyl-(pentapeptide) pyrophosphoryl-undecaprenol N-acetylglucosamine transferase [Patescibacteria group bacterium]